VAGINSEILVIHPLHTNNSMATQPLNQPTVSVIMNCLNCAKYLREAIDSVFAQTYKDWEIIFWDNASTDNSAKIAKSYGEKVRYFRSNITYPLGKARNLAIEQARGKYIAFLDCDDIWLPKKLERQIPFFQDPEVGLVFSDAIYFKSKNVSMQLYRKKRPPCGQVFRELLKGNFFFPMCTALIRKDALLGLREWFDVRFNLVEDIDLFMRLAYAWKCNYIDKPLAKYRIHESSWTFTQKELLPKEMEMEVAKLCQLYPCLETDFKDELAVMNGRIQYQYALLDWEKGRGKRVRQRLRPYLKVARKYWVPYFFSFLPYNVLYLRLRKLRTTIRYCTWWKKI